MRTLILLLALVGLVSDASELVSDPTPRIEQIISVQRIRSALYGAEARRDGFGVELRTTALSGHAARVVIITKYARGEAVGSAWLAYSHADEFLRELDEIGLEDFRFEEEIASIEKQAASRGERLDKPDALDGEEWEFRYNRTNVELCVRQWNLGPTVDFYGKHSTKIQKVGAILNLVARYWGRHDLGV